MNKDSLSKLNKDELVVLLKESDEKNEHLEFLLENINGVSWEFDLLQNTFTYVSSNAKRILGYEREEWNTFESWINMLYEEDKEKTVNFCSTQTKNGKNHLMEYRMVTKNGEVIWMLDLVSVDKDDKGNPVKLQGFLMDITEKKGLELQLEEEYHYLQSIINNISAPILVVKDDYTVELINETTRKKLQKVEMSEENIARHHEVPKTAGSIRAYIDLQGNNYFVELGSAPVVDKEKGETSDFKAHLDALTTLPNRFLFTDRLEQAIHTCKRDKSKLALMVLDLDDFKSINKSLGHQVGDEALIAISKKISGLLRASDTFSRLSGDKFTVIMKNIKQNADASILANKIIKALDEPLALSIEGIHVSCSIGISIYPDVLSSKELLYCSDMAMRKTKELGKNSFTYYEE